jgi:hypothetical protein
MLLTLGWGAVARASEADAVAAADARDTLVYKDGDRVHGKVVERTAEVIVFQSDRFGELRVKPSDAVVIKGVAKPADRQVKVEAQGIQPAPAAPRTAAASPKPPAKPAPKPEPPKTAAESAEEEKISIWERFTPALLTARVRNIFGPWHGKLAFSSEVVSDAAERNNSSWEARLSRKWKADEVTMTARFDYAETNDLTTTDMVKLTGQWRHEFNKKLFAHYRPTGEWNRAPKKNRAPNDYVLLQQEVGAGYHLLTTPARKVRAGVSQNRFDTWTLEPTSGHAARDVQSLFEEVELTLPWRMSLTQRGVWYPVGGQDDGWENRVELNKKLTETLSTSVRHEIRRDNPDGSAQDYTRLKLLFGLDF